MNFDFHNYLSARRVECAENKYGFGSKAAVNEPNLFSLRIVYDPLSIGAL